jgi:membrane protease YdiL (CAAX protease family)
MPARLIAGVASAVAVGVLLYFPDRDDGSGAVLGALCALVAVPIGLAALADHRSLPARTTGEHARLILLTFALGVALGIANLAINYGMALYDPAIHQQMVTRWAEFQAWSVVISGPIMEEIAFRLVLMSVVAWTTARFTDNRRTIFVVALGVSSGLFGLAHIGYGGVDSPLYKAGMAVKSAAAGLVLGWVFWRRGLPYSMVCHCTANAIHLALMPMVF